MKNVRKLVHKEYPNYIVFSDGTVINANSGLKVREKFINNKGKKRKYPQFYLKRKDGSATLVNVSRIVWETFTPNYQKIYDEIKKKKIEFNLDHIDNNHLNNSFDNLKIMPKRVNTIDGVFTNSIDILVKNLEFTKIDVADCIDLLVDKLLYHKYKNILNKSEKQTSRILKRIKKKKIKGVK